MKIVTGKTGTNHITSEDDGSFNAGVVGIGDYVLKVGKELGAVITSNNIITLSDGEIVMQGRHGRIEPNATEQVKIDNGAQGVQRIDTIVCEYTRSGDIEKMQLRVVKGIPSSSIPAAPEIATGDIRNGDILHQMPLYDVQINGIEIQKLTKRFRIIKGLCEHEDELDHIVQRLIAENDKKKYPVGSIIMSANPANPETYMGFGKWAAWGAGRVPVGVNASDTKFNTVEKQGGEAEVTLGANQIPAHAHSVNAINVNTGNNSAGHTHSIPAQTVNTGNQSANHTHSIPALSGTAASAGNHAHAITYQAKHSASGNNLTQIYADGSGPQTSNNAIKAGGAHTHNVSINGGTTGGNSGSHTHSVTTPAATSGGQSANHTHGVSIGAHNTNNSGGGQAHSNLQPYIVCYMWKRTA